MINVVAIILARRGSKVITGETSFIFAASLELSEELNNSNIRGNLFE